ncbi:nucleotidyltransferase family protein [Winogradskyella pulchriflava]|uniref:NTP transferase domain-containing protein n=1 Tax=Winogradskyella pulchriflava TaxID=1110688 RepID=A0ABV6Q7F2_9FLAO
MSNIAILILAAGSSSRMKIPKQLLPVGNKTLLGLTLENALNSKANNVHLVLGANSEEIKNSIKDISVNIILNPNYNKGLSTSIIEGVKHIQSKSYDAVVIMLADQPRLDTSYINQLMDAFDENPEHIIASKYSNVFGVPAIFPKSAFEQLLKLKGDKGAKTFLNSEKAKVIAINTTEFKDIDTPKDYKDFLESL